MDEEPRFTFACPRCCSPLLDEDETTYRCPGERLRFVRTGGIWRFLLPERRQALGTFMREYETVRQAEGRGSDDPAYFRALPFEDLTGRYAHDWRIRAVSFQALLKRAVEPLEKASRQPLRVLDLGAGNGWLSYRLALRGHAVAAVDLMDNDFDGLGAHRHYDVAFLPVQAEFDRLPFLENQADLAVFNASFHYATDYERALREALRVLLPHGCLVILDTPVYHNAASGQAMVHEREEAFRQRFGFPSNALPSENFLTYDRLAELGARLHLRWETHEPWYGLRWALRPWIARLLGRREPARFLLIIGRRA